MGLLCGARERSFERGTRKVLKLHSVGTIVLCIALIAIYIFVFSVVSIDSEEGFTQNQPWPSQQVPRPAGTRLVKQFKPNQTKPILLSLLQGLDMFLYCIFPFVSGIYAALHSIGGDDSSRGFALGG